MLKILILSIHPAPYRDFTFQCLQCRGRIKFSVSYYFNLDHGHEEWEWVPLYYPYRFSNHQVSRLWIKQPIHFDIIWQVCAEDYDVLIVPGYSRATSILAIFIARLRAKPVILSMDRIKESQSLRLSSRLKSRIRRIILNLCQGYWVPGYATTHYLLSKGIGAETIAQGVYCPDNIGFCKEVERLREISETLREEIGINSGHHVVLAVGKMIPLRRYDDLIQAWADIKPNRNATLLLIGDGPQERQLMALVRELRLSNVKFAGPCSTGELPKYYALSDSYVHPGEEPFSTALELASAAGLSILANKSVGYVSDLLMRSGSPVLFDFGSISDLTKKLEMLVSEEHLPQDYRKSCPEIGMPRTPDWAASELESLAYKLTGKEAHG